MKQNKPIRKARVGRFQMTTWAFEKIIRRGEKDSTAEIEQPVRVERACIQYSTRDKLTGEWRNQRIWCALDDIRCLAQAIDQFDEWDHEASDASVATDFNDSPQPN